MSLNMVVREFESKEQMSVGPKDAPIPLSYSKKWTFLFVPKGNTTAEELESKMHSVIDMTPKMTKDEIDNFIDENFITEGNLFNRKGYGVVHLDSLIPFRNPNGEDKRTSWLREHYNKEIFEKYCTHDYRVLMSLLFAKGNIKNISIKDEVDVHIYQDDEKHFKNNFEVDGTRILSFEFGNRLYSITFGERVFLGFDFEENNKVLGVAESNYNDGQTYGGLMILSTTNKDLDPSELYDEFLENYNKRRDINVVLFNEFFYLIGRELQKQGIINENPVRFMPTDGVER